MFELFKKKTGKEKFIDDITKTFERQYNHHDRKYGREDSFPIGISIVFSEIKEKTISKKTILANAFGISEQEVFFIVNDISTKVYNKYFTLF